MRLLHRDTQSILPRVETLFLLSRTAKAIGIAAYFLTIFERTAFNIFDPLLVILVGELAILLGTWVLFQQRRQSSSYLYLLIHLFDITLITILVRITGGITSDFYVFFLFSMTVGAYMMTISATIIFAALISGLYVLGNFDTIGEIEPLNLVIRIAIVWFFAIIINYVAEYIRRSESRLLNLFNTLNKRTSELEKIHAQLEMVYDNSRILAGILDFDQIIEEILKIGEKVLDYPALGVMLVGPGRSLIYRGRLIGGERNIRLKAVPRGTMELAYRVFRHEEPARVVDLSSRSDYQPLLKSAKSAMLVPMITHGKITGLLIAESPRVGAFEEHDEKFLSVLARSAAMSMENSILHRKTEELTIIDELTGIFNYRYFSEKIKEEKRRAVRYNQPLSLIMLDIDWFKRFNDNYGHEVGNRVLVGLVGVIKRCIRDVDILCRYGGEEFIVILPNTAERETHRIAERIRIEVERAVFGGGDNIPKLKVTVSIGVSSYPENNLPEEELINAVDQAMYRAKGSGKNMVCTV